MQKRVGVAILGLGVVGGGTYKTLVNHRDFYLKTQNVDIVVESVLDKNTARLKELGVPEECIAGSIAEVVECSFTTGPYSILVKMYAHDNEQLMDLLNNKIQSIPGVVSTETMIVLDSSIKRNLPME